MKLQCTCHGVSGSCVTQTCWMSLPKFTDVGSALRDRFDGSVKVIPRNNGRSFMPSQNVKPPGPRDLVYIENSPTFCRANNKIGSFGTVGRECKPHSLEEDGCGLLCCSRGYNQRTISEVTSCNCTFIVCCKVVCQTCIKERELFTCK